MSRLSSYEIKAIRRENFHYRLLLLVNLFFLCETLLEVDFSPFKVSWSANVSSYKLSQLGSILMTVSVMLIGASVWSLGVLRGNAARVTPQQFSDLFEMACEQCKKLEMELPTIYVQNGHGVFDSLASQLLFGNHITLYADVLKMTRKQGGEQAIAFILARELAHVKRKHTSIRTWMGSMAWLIILFRNVDVLEFFEISIEGEILIKREKIIGICIRFFPTITLFFAYCRRCEYTCDAIATALAPEKAIEAIIAVAVGPHFYDRVDIQRLAKDWKKSWISNLWLLFRPTPFIVDRFHNVNEWQYGKKKHQQSL